MKIAKFALDPATEPKINHDVRAILRRRLTSAVGFVILACFLTAFSELSEREILALAISLEEDDARIYGDYAERLKADYPHP
jgi:hypothetical protein